MRELWAEQPAREKARGLKGYGMFKKIPVVKNN